jgi:hypothetical protein
MKYALVVIALIIAGSRLCADDITTLRGEKFPNVTVSRVEPDGIVVIKSDGIVKIPFSDLSPELRAKYGYDPEKAAQYNAAVQAAAAQFNAAVQAAPAQGESTATPAQLPKEHIVRIFGKVRTAGQVGLLVETGLQYDLNYSHFDSPAGRPKNAENGKYYVTGHPKEKQIVDDDWIDVDAVQDGTYSYAGGKVKQYRIIRAYDLK